MNTDIDIGLARYSDWAFTSSVLVLVGALVLLAIELAYSRSRKVEQRELVTASGPPPVAPADSAPGVVAERPKRPVDERTNPGPYSLHPQSKVPIEAHRQRRTRERDERAVAHPL